jgi:hypothetical protein
MNPFYQNWCLATDGASKMMRNKCGVVEKLQDKLNAVFPSCEFSHVQCVMHQEMLYSKVANMERVLAIVKKSVKFFLAHGLNSPCGGGLEYLHPSPASRRRRQKGTHCSGV